MRILLILIAPLLLGAESDCLLISGDRILASDLAKRLELFQQVAADAEIGFTPLPGGRRMITSAEIQRAAVKNGVSAAVASDSIRADLCVQRQTRLLRVEEVERALRLEMQNQGIQNASVEILDFSRYPVPEGQPQFSKSGLTPPAQNNLAMQPVLWRGRIMYGVSHSLPIWARVRIFVDAEVLLAARDIAAGTIVAEGDTTVEKRRMFPSAGTPLASSLIVTGKRTRRALKKGDLVTIAVLESVKDIERGEKVNVAVSSGSAHLRLDAIAETSGRIGERVLVKNPTSGKRFQATVESKGHVTVVALAEEQK